jgi:hypothetical protein
MISTAFPLPCGFGKHASSGHIRCCQRAASERHPEICGCSLSQNFGSVDPGQSIRGRMFTRVGPEGRIMRPALAGAFAASFILAISAAAYADSTYEYYFSMRLGSLGGPQFVSASPTQSDTQSAAVPGCDGVTYYLTSADASALSSALTSGATVQLHRAPSGTAPPDAPVRCMVQASQ